MPKFLVTSGSHFKPFTYDELVRPVAEAAAAHNATQDAYDTLTTETEALRQYIMQEPNDSEARRMYNTYVSQLSELQNDLWNNGYNASTRRGLSAARAGYASDITRLGTAIKTRQDRSNEYWKAKHDHPDMIMGSDPGTESLDKYLANDRFGQDYYSYSGLQFMNEVGIDAKARASEMLKDPQIMKDPRLVGYLTRIVQHGFTNAEVDSAYFAVRAMMEGDSSKLEALDPASAILANVLSTNMESTGAAGKVSQSEMLRLLDYGRKGLSQAIGERKDELVADKQWANEAQLELERKKADIEVDTYRRKKEFDNPEPVPTDYGYEDNAAYQRLLSKTAQKTADDMHDTFHKNYTNEDGSKKKVPIKLPNNGLVLAENATDATEVVYNNEHRKRILDEMGLDIALPGYGLFRTNKPLFGSAGKQVSPDKRFMTDDLSREDEKRLGLKQGAVAVKEYVNGKWVLNDGYTLAFNKAKTGYDAYIKRTKELNPNLKLSDYTLLPDQVEKIIKKYPEMEGVPFTDLETAILRKEVDQLSVAPQLVGTGQEFDDARQRYARLIDDFYAGLSGAEGLGKNSIGAFYKVGKGGYDYSENGETDKAKVFTLTKDGHIDPNCISSIYMLPQDVNETDTKLRIRVIDKNGKGTDWVVSSKMLGPVISGALNSRNFVVGLSYLSAPMSRSTDMFKVSDAESAKWAAGALNILGGRRYPMQGNDYPTGKEVLRNDQLYNQYISAVNAYLQDYLSVPLDRATLGVRQHPGYTSTKATSKLR